MYNEKLWNKVYEPLKGRTLRELLISEGGGDFVFEEYIKGEFGETMLRHLLPWVTHGEAHQMDEEVLDYWKSQGIIKRMHHDADINRSWVIYMPDDASFENGPYPMIFMDHGLGRDFQDLEAWGVVQLVKQEHIFVAAVYDGNNTEYVRETVETITGLFPVDKNRVYLLGHSFSGNTAARISISYPELFAGLAMLGAHNQGDDTTPAEIVRAENYGMPRIDIAGTCEYRSLPLNRDPEECPPPSPQIARNATPVESGLPYVVTEQNLFRRINHMPEMDAELARNIQKTSSDICEQKIGMKMDRTEVRNLGSVLHYIGDVYDNNGELRMRQVGIEGAPHYPSAFAGALSWEFFKNFRRNPETGKIELIREEK